MNRRSRRILPAVLALMLAGCAEQSAAPAQTVPSAAEQTVSESAAETSSLTEAQTSAAARNSASEYTGYFHTQPDEAGYLSGKIVIGDSRCCQLGSFQQSSGGTDFAAFAVWGGHYAPERYPQIFTEQSRAEIADCFRAQAAACGHCTVFFFATINDYDYTNGESAQRIQEAIARAEEIASLSCTVNGQTVKPQVIVIGFAGLREDPSSRTDYNHYIHIFNGMLYAAVTESELLKANAALFTTVPLLTNGQTDFISDGVHYGTKTLQTLTDYIAAFDSEASDTQNTAERTAA